MNSKWTFVLLITLYVITLAINFTVSAKFPDLKIEMFHLIASILFFIVLIFAIIKTVRYVNWFLLAGAVGSLFVSFAQQFEELLTSYWIVDVLSGLQYPLYVIFITPLFGLNYVFGMLPGEFALICAGLFFVLFVATKISTELVKKKHVSNV